MMTMKSKVKLYGMSGIFIMILGMTVFSVAAPAQKMKPATSVREEEGSEDGAYATLGIYLESEDRAGNEHWPFKREANQGCVARTVGLKDLTPQSSQEFPKHSCVQNDRLLYGLDQLTIDSCQWELKGEMNAQFPLLNALTGSLVLKDFKVQFREDTLWCESDLVLKDGSKVAIEGACAVADPSPFKTVNGKVPVSGENVLIFDVGFVQEENALLKTIHSVKGVGLRPQLIFMMAVPLNKTGSSYLDYMLSQKGIDDCQKIK